MVWIIREGFSNKSILYDLKKIEIKLFGEFSLNIVGFIWFNILLWSHCYEHFVNIGLGESPIEVWKRHASIKIKLYSFSTE